MFNGLSPTRVKEDVDKVWQSSKGVPPKQMLRKIIDCLFNQNFNADPDQQFKMGIPVMRRLLTTTTTILTSFAGIR
jgi:hypothetical protein